MARKKLKWKFTFLFYLVYLSVFSHPLPLSKDQVVLATTEYYLNVLDVTSPFFHDSKTTTEIFIDITEIPENSQVSSAENEPEEQNATSENNESLRNETTFNNTKIFPDPDLIAINSLLRNDPIRPGQTVTQYTLQLNLEADSFSGRALVRTELTTDTLFDSIMFYVGDLNINSVQYGVLTISNPIDTDFFVEDGILMIEPPAEALSYIFLIEFSDSYSNDGYGLHYATVPGGTDTYVAMNLYPTNARRVFPCIDELTEESTVSITINNADTGFNHVIGNSFIASSDSGLVQLTPLSGLLHKWGVVANNFIHLNNPVTDGKLYVRSGITNQDSQAAVIINYVYNQMQAWTNKPYTEIIANQEGSINFIAMPDITKDWVALSTVPIWEPNILMLSSHAVAQRKTAMVEISKAIARQWFGYVIHPEDWRYQWIIEGIGSHVAYEMARKFQGQATDTDNTVVDIDAVFVAEVIQEALLRDSYEVSSPLELDSDILTDSAVREHVNGIIKYKAPAVMYMLKNLLGEATNISEADGVVAAEDYIQTAARALLSSRSLQSVNRLNFVDAVNSEWTSAETKLIDNLTEYLEPWIFNNHYPVLYVQLRTSGVIVTQERFGFSSTTQITYTIPITYTTSVNPDFNDTTVGVVMDNNLILDLYLDDEAEDWVIFNLQGQGYYRVNYDTELWERLIIALSDADTRAVIHPINRATLLDDALNLARAGKLDYDIAFRLVLTMELETEYVVWRAFIRNMDFIRTRLVAMVTDDEELDPDIYLRMVRRTVTGLESELTFYPDPLIIEDAMSSMARGIVMEHACKANYAPCIAAAVDWFYDPSSTDLVINSNIPHDIRPAVYCAVVMDGDETARDLLWAEMETTNSMYERLVIVKSLACSQDETYLLEILNSAISDGAGLGVEERAQFFMSMIESSYANAQLALRFIRSNTAAIRSMFGGSENLEKISYLLAQNMATADLTDTFDIWVNSINSDLDDSVDIVEVYSSIAKENVVWNTAYMQTVYDWIDENDATTSVLSLTLIIASLFITLFR